MAIIKKHFRDWMEEANLIDIDMAKRLNQVVSVSAIGRYRKGSEIPSVSASFAIAHELKAELYNIEWGRDDFRKTIIEKLSDKVGCSEEEMLIEVPEEERTLFVLEILGLFMANKIRLENGLWRLSTSENVT